MRQKLIELYRRLETEHGKQNWWPAESPYEVMVGAILTQNTNWRNVEKAIANLKSADLLYPHMLLETENRKLETLIRPSGFYRQKTERLKLATKKWLELAGKAHYSRMKTELLRKHWLSVKGIGKETADSILLYAFNRPIFVIDEYTRRFCDYYNLFKAKEYDEYRIFFERILPKRVKLYKEYHALIVQWGKNR
jgi:endonuclease-3 related protein